ncbi:MAG TPA: hypothetical protein VGO56_06520 [Pyrinomonadaceae bacterium]|jgi:hypothetical protein|nr:hypothetical protein [Pyrinomonadaceae bacterium]
MGNINLGRVLLGGLLAGLVLNIGEFLLNDFVLGAQMKEFLTRHNFAEPGTNLMIVAIGLTFVLGIVIVLGYACIRPRFGAGVKTAIIAGLFAWFGVYFYSGIIDGTLFGIPMGAMAMVVVWGLVEYCIAAVAGAWLYKEA